MADGKVRAAWPPSEEQAVKLGPPPLCLFCGAETVWDEMWSGVFVACCTKDYLHLGDYARVAEGLVIHACRKK